MRHFRRQSLQTFGKALPAENFPLPTGRGLVLRLPAKWSLITWNVHVDSVPGTGNPMRSSGFRLVDIASPYSVLKTIRR